VWEPYRELLRPLKERLQATLQHCESSLSNSAVRPGPNVLRDPSEITEPLELCRRSLLACGYGVIADGRLKDLLRRTAVFGLTLVELDLRQQADRHTEVLDFVTRATDLAPTDNGMKRNGRLFLSTVW